MTRKHVRLSSIIHIGKESNELDKSELFGLDKSSYDIYEDKLEIERKFLEKVELA